MSPSAAEIALYLASVADPNVERGIAHQVEALGDATVFLGPRRLGVLRFPIHGVFDFVTIWVSGDAPALHRPGSADRFYARQTRPYWYRTMLETSGTSFGRTETLPDEASIERAVFEREGVRTYVHTPIRTGQRVLGALIWAFPTDHDPDSEAMTRLLESTDDLADAFGVGLLRLDSIDDPGAELAHRLVRADDRALRLELYEIMRELGGSLEADRAGLLVLNRDDDTVSLGVGWATDRTSIAPTMLAPSDARVPSNRWPWSVGEMIAGRIVRLGDVHDTPPEAAEDRATWAIDGVRALLMIPLHAHDVLLGALVINRTEVGDWTDRQIHRAEMIATSIATIVDRLSRAERARTDARREHDLLTATMELIGELSHELKTPVHTIAGFAELIDDTNLSDPDRDALAAMRDAATRLGTVVDDLLAAARPHEGATTEVLPVLRQIVKQFDSISIAHAVHIDCDSLDPTTTVPLDAPRTRQLLRCLVSGALLGAGHDGTIRFRADDDGETLVVDVDSREIVPPAALGFPVAHAIVGDHATIEIDRLDDDPSAYGAVVRTRFRRSSVGA